ncbi:hypothetical protein [Bradyrhizobium sp. AZCC 1693]|uniref:hypothetical protein n=1 Tax=Bradyrhizobium sp. AZCC 1693 TaxID=3117029 RepID=UPI002FF13708
MGKATGSRERAPDDRLRVPTIALFGAPHVGDNHAVTACHAAIEPVRRIKLLEYPGLHVRVGIHSGYVVAHALRRNSQGDPRQDYRSYFDQSEVAQPDAAWC